MTKSKMLLAAAATLALGAAPASAQEKAAAPANADPNTTAGTLSFERQR